MVRRRRRRMEGQVRKYRRKFTGQRDDTLTVAQHTHPDGSKYLERKNESKYPKPTSIPVSFSVLEICRRLKHHMRFNNYDELLLFLTKSWLYSKDHSVGKSTVDYIEEYLSKARTDKILRTNARNKAIFKHRYRPR